jgi:GNAT superfamily N-acetyltransferase
MTHPSTLELESHPLTPDRWPDLEALFGPRGATGGCWCMWWRLRRSEWREGKGEGNRQAFKAVVDAGDPPGLLAYADGRPVGWCAIAPRSEYPGLERTRNLKPVDDQPVWSITCFFIASTHRRRGVTVLLLEAAVAWAAGRGATIVEGYPTEPRKDAMPDAFAWTGTASAFRKAGFEVALRRSESRPIMRYVIGTARS